MRINYIDGIRLKQAVIAGARRVILMQDALNRINVFPVPDNDTGTNMALTMQSIAEAAINCHHRSVSVMSQHLAESALMGARGNSGAILAQFFQGLSEKVKGHYRITMHQFADAVVEARNSSYEAISEPQEGTILTVIHDWAEKIKSHCSHAHDFLDLMKTGLHEAERSLKETPKRLKLLANAGVVDAGAQGFVHLLEGILHFLQSGKLEKAVGLGDLRILRAKVEKAPQDIAFQYCTECFLEGENIDRRQLRDQIAALGNSLIVAGSSEKIRLHIHTNEPQRVFDIAGQFGRVSNPKFDDMRKQHSDGFDKKAASNIALVTDSSCDLPPEYIIRHNIQTVPIQLTFGNETFIDKITITPREFYRLLAQNQHYPTTSQPAPGDFKVAFEEVLGHYDQVLAIMLSGALSGTLQAAQTAAKSINRANIHVLNSQNTSVALGLIVAQAADAIEQGCELSEVIARTKRAIANTRFFVTFRSVAYLIRGGRLGRSRGLIANTLNLKPIISLNSAGEAVTIARAFSDEAALRKIMALVCKETADKKNLRFAVAHANAPERAAWLEHQIRSKFDVDDIITTNVSPALGAHAGPGAAGVAFLGE